MNCLNRQLKCSENAVRFESKRHIIMRLDTPEDGNLLPPQMFLNSQTYLHVVVSKVETQPLILVLEIQSNCHTFFLYSRGTDYLPFTKNQADEELLISSRSSNKYRYQANRAFVIGRMKRILPKILCGILKLPSVVQLFQDPLRCRSQIIPGRSFRRKKIKMKGRTHFNHQKAAF